MTRIATTPEPPLACIARADGISRVGLRYLAFQGWDEQGREHWRTKVITFPGDKVIVDRACVIETPVYR